MAKAPERTQRRHLREKATIDHLVRDVYKPKPAHEEDRMHGPTTSSGLPIEDPRSARNGTNVVLVINRGT